LNELSISDNKGINKLSKATSLKETEPSTAFVELLQQISRAEEGKKENDGLLSLINPHLLIVPTEKPRVEGAPANVNEAAINDQANASISGIALLQSKPTSEAFLIENSNQRIANLDPMVGSGAQESEKSAVIQAISLEALKHQESNEIVSKMDQPSVHSVLYQKVIQQMDNSLLNPVINNPKPEEMSSGTFEDNELVYQQGKEQPETPLLLSGNTGNSFVPPINTTYSSGTLGSEIPVRADQIAKDLTNVFTSAIDVQNNKDGIEATFSLKPEHLGKVDVKVVIHEGIVSAEFFTSTALGKDLLETQVLALRSALEQIGFHVDKIDISQQNTNFSGPFSQKGDSHSRQGQQESKKRNAQEIYLQEEEYRDFAAESGLVSQINTTA
jgi:flagellar hook-length control protein FliK